MSARLSRRWLLIGALACIAVFVIWLLLPLLGEQAVPAFAEWGVIGTPATVFKVNTVLGFAANTGLFLGILLLTQWAFLRPIRRAALHGPGRPRWPVVFAVALVATLLCTALAATILELPDWWSRITGYKSEMGRGWSPVWVAMGVAWLAWAGVFFVYFRDGDFLAKNEVVVRALIRGSCLELLIAIPTHALVYRRGNDECFCARGSYTGMVFGVAVLLWAFGPGLVLLFLREKQRREPILQKLCPQCGATLDLAPSSPVTCSHCGHVSLR